MPIKINQKPHENLLKIHAKKTNTMKTAMQEFIESLRAIGVSVHNTDIFLSKEKEQIMDAYVNGKRHLALNSTKTFSPKLCIDPEVYYNKTYNEQ